MIAANDNAPAGASIRYRVEPRLVPVGKAARRLHLLASEFEAKRAALEAAGFPQPCPVLGYYDLVAIDGWLDRLAGLGAGDPRPALPDLKTRLARLG